MKTTSNQMVQLINKLNELREKKWVSVPCDLVNNFVELGSGFGLNIMGGAISNDCTEQILYIE